MQLRRKRALITGGSRGIGAAIALNLAEQGTDIVINARHDDPAAQAVMSQVTARDCACHLAVADMARPQEVERCVEEAANALGGLDIVVHNAGGPAPGQIEEISTADWNYAFDVHVHAAFHLIRHSLPWLRRNDEGAIVLVSSVAGFRGCPGALAYGTVKGAILQFTRMLARDLADDNIRVNCVAPGIIRTRFHEKMTPDQQRHNLAQRIPLHREGTSEQVADVVQMLIANDFMTGESVTIDGGMSMQVVR